MKRRAICVAVVAAVLGAGTPVQAQTNEIIHMYVYYDGWEEVGGAQDTCDVTGEVRFRQLTWGYATEDFVAHPLYRCLNGVLAPI